MKAISLKQPWATLVTMGVKKIETRSWQPKDPEIIKQIKEEGLLIHASKNQDMAKLFCNVPAKDPFAKYIRNYNDLPYGAIIGKVSFNGAFSMGAVWGMIEQNMACTIGGIDVFFSVDEIAFGDYSPDRFGWMLSDERQFKDPVPCNGCLSVWDVPADILKLLPL